MSHIYFLTEQAAVGGDVFFTVPLVVFILRGLTHSLLCNVSLTIHWISATPKTAALSVKLISLSLVAVRLLQLGITRDINLSFDTYKR